MGRSRRKHSPDSHKHVDRYRARVSRSRSPEERAKSTKRKKHRSRKEHSRSPAPDKRTRKRSRDRSPSVDVHGDDSRRKHADRDGRRPGGSDRRQPSTILDRLTFKAGAERSRHHHDEYDRPAMFTGRVQSPGSDARATGPAAMVVPEEQFWKERDSARAPAWRSWRLSASPDPEKPEEPQVRSSVLSRVTRVSSALPDTSEHGRHHRVIVDQSFRAARQRSASPKSPWARPQGRSPVRRPVHPDVRDRPGTSDRPLSEARAGPRGRGQKVDPELVRVAANDCSTSHVKPSLSDRELRQDGEDLGRDGAREWRETGREGEQGGGVPVGGAAEAGKRSRRDKKSSSKKEKKRREKDKKRTRQDTGVREHASASPEPACAAAAAHVDEQDAPQGSHSLSPRPTKRGKPEAAVVDRHADRSHSTPERHQPLPAAVHTDAKQASTDNRDGSHGPLQRHQGDVRVDARDSDLPGPPGHEHAADRGRDGIQGNSAQRGAVAGQQAMQAAGDNDDASLSDFSDRLDLRATKRQKERAHSSPAPPNPPRHDGGGMTAGVHEPGTTSAAQKRGPGGSVGAKPLADGQRRSPQPRLPGTEHKPRGSPLRAPVQSGFSGVRGVGGVRGESAAPGRRPIAPAPPPKSSDMKPNTMHGDLMGHGWGVRGGMAAGLGGDDLTGGAEDVGGVRDLMGDGGLMTDRQGWRNGAGGGADFQGSGVSRPGAGSDGEGDTPKDRHDSGSRMPLWRGNGGADVAPERPEVGGLMHRPAPPPPRRVRFPNPVLLNQFAVVNGEGKGRTMPRAVMEWRKVVARDLKVPDVPASVASAAACALLRSVPGGDDSGGGDDLEGVGASQGVCGAGLRRMVDPAAWLEVRPKVARITAVTAEEDDEAWRKKVQACTNTVFQCSEMLKNLSKQQAAGVRGGLATATG